MDQKSKREERRDDTQTQRSSFYLLFKYYSHYSFLKLYVVPGCVPGVHPVLVEILY